MGDKYPLSQVLLVKKDRVEKARQVVEQKKEALHVEEKRLASLEEEKERIQNHHDDKLAQLRESLDQGEPSAKIIDMKQYLKLVKQDLYAQEKKVEEQEKKVDDAKKALEQAREEWKRRRMEEEKLLLHKKEWEHEVKKEQVRQEGREENELGSILHQTRKRKKRGH